MATQIFSKNTVLGKNTKFDGSVHVDGDLTCVGLAIEGDLTVSGSVLAERSLHVGGNVSVGQDLDSGLLLRARGDVSAGGDVTAANLQVDGTVKAQGNITAQETIFVRNDLDASGSIQAAFIIHAGGAIRAAGWVKCPNFEIYCQSLRTKLLPLGRGFWASLPILAKWRDDILDAGKSFEDLRKLLTPEECQELANTRFGHWTLEGQLRMFLCVEDQVEAPSEARRPLPAFNVPPTTDTVVPCPPRPPVPNAETNELLAVVEDPKITPFPNYATNASYQSILKNLKASGRLDTDLRAAYPNLDLDLSTLYSDISSMSVPDQSVKTQILNEINAAINIRIMHGNLRNFIEQTIFVKQLRLTYVGDMIKMEDNVVCEFNPDVIIQSLLSALGALPDAGPIFKIAGAVYGLVTSMSGGGGGMDPVDAKFVELEGKLSAEFDKLNVQNDKMTVKLISSWGKLHAANELIADGTLSWPVDESSSILAAGNAYELEVFKSLLPIHWHPMYSTQFFDRDTRKNCGNTAWMQVGGWGYNRLDPFVAWVPYWLTYGHRAKAGCREAEERLATLGVSIKDLTMGGGKWGTEIWRFDRANAVGTWQYPDCVGG